MRGGGAVLRGHRQRHRGGADAQRHRRALLAAYHREAGDAALCEHHAAAAVRCCDGHGGALVGCLGGQRRLGHLVADVDGLRRRAGRRQSVPAGAGRDHEAGQRRVRALGVVLGDRHRRLVSGQQADAAAAVRPERHIEALVALLQGIVGDGDVHRAGVAGLGERRRRGGRRGGGLAAPVETGVADQRIADPLDAAVEICRRLAGSEGCIDGAAHHQRPVLVAGQVQDRHHRPRFCGVSRVRKRAGQGLTLSNRAFACERESVLGDRDRRVATGRPDEKGQRQPAEEQRYAGSYQPGSRLSRHKSDT